MERLTKEYVLSVAETISTQLRALTPTNVLLSWGISKAFATQISVALGNDEIYMAALAIQVQGFCYDGLVLIAYDEGSDYYRIYTRSKDGSLDQKFMDVGFDQMSELLDQLIEKGTMSDEEYFSRVSQEYKVVASV